MTKIGKYEITRELGRGAMGIVYEGVDPYIGRKVAIKTIRFDVILGGAEHDAAQARFMREARSAGSLNHPSIVTIYDVGEDNGLTYIAMEYVDGESLEARIAARNKPAVHEVIDLVAQIGEALDYAHRNGVVHRDIKPANILVDREGRPRIVDFGIARIASSSLTQTNTILGTPSYMAPEQIAGLPPDHRVDLFALGAILYELLTLAKAFPGEHVTTVIYKIMNVEPTPPRELDLSLPAGLDEVVKTALAKDPVKRFQSGRALTEALRNPPHEERPAATAVTESVPVPAAEDLAQAVIETPTPVAPVPVPADRRRTQLMIVVAAMMVLVVAVVAVMFWRSVSVVPSGPAEGAPVDPAVVATTPDATTTVGASPQAPTPGQPTLPAGGLSGAGATTVPASAVPAGVLVSGKTAPRAAASTARAPQPVRPPPLPSVPETALPAAAAAESPSVAPTARGRVYEPTGVDERPRITTQVPPAYPEGAKRRRLEATVVLKVLVGETGRVDDVRILRGAQVDPAFDQAAIEAVRRWVFVPARKNGQPVASWYNVGVPFQLPR